ncbi:AzlD domain-containing protein [Lactococcus laudensis]|uniref:AzlD domain-containing protein n=1 Tax=Pseudolactococcus laudensis TaxID=1494461 RepID=A0A7V8N275_9LACT|nr:AzlD domain-containing protein [Lactococcus laudensis]MBA0017226.1 AzlD domain-containing protein [Lactococcus laudensis]MBW9281989.1 AzlD domain-containing protein [Lactococcus laudensis]
MYFYLALFFSVIVTWVPRILSFPLAKLIQFPAFFKRFLNYLSLSMMTSLMVSELLILHKNALPSFDGLRCVAMIPAMVVGYLRKSLMFAVVTGVITMALLRLLVV